MHFLEVLHRLKAVILAGDLGTQISEVSAVRPKPMIEIGGILVLWYILKIYSHYGVTISSSAWATSVT